MIPLFRDIMDICADVMKTSTCLFLSAEANLTRFRCEKMIQHLEGKKK